MSCRSPVREVQYRTARFGKGNFRWQMPGGQTPDWPWPQQLLEPAGTILRTDLSRRLVL